MADHKIDGNHGAGNVQALDYDRRQVAYLQAVVDRLNAVIDKHNTDCEALSAQLSAANARADAAGSALERDRSFVADTVNAVHSEISGREWMLTGRGPYEWDDDRYRDEFGSALSAIRAPIEKLRAIARDWSNCPTDPVEIQKSRTDWKARADAAWDALRNIAELNKTARDENGHVWDKSDLIAQEIHYALRAKPACDTKTAENATQPGLCDTSDPQTAPTVTVQEAARVLLAVHDGFMDGEPYDKTEADRLFLSASFGAQAFAICPQPEARPSAMLRAFLLALIDPTDPQLDYLRAKNVVRAIAASEA